MNAQLILILYKKPVHRDVRNNRLSSMTVMPKPKISAYIYGIDVYLSMEKNLLILSSKAIKGFPYLFNYIVCCFQELAISIEKRHNRVYCYTCLTPVNQPLWRCVFSVDLAAARVEHILENAGALISLPPTIPSVPGSLHIH